jgi:ATP-dependent helicase IRC3
MPLARSPLSPSAAPGTPAQVALRPYQREAIDAVLAARRAGVRRMLVCLPTGAGKTVIFSHLAGLARRPVLVLAHREELLQQARQKLEGALATAGAGVVAIEQGAHSAPDDARVLVCSIRSLHEQRLARVISRRAFGLVIYDECHHAAAEDNLRVLRQLGAMDAAWTGTLLGFTATTARGDGKGLDSIFERIVYTRTLPTMIDDGFLAPLRGVRISTAADLTRLSSGGADFREDELGEAVDIEERNALVARSIQELTRDRRTIAFCVNVNHARNLCRSLNALGVTAGIVYGAMPASARTRALADFREGRTQVLTNVAVLTEGFDDPGGIAHVALDRLHAVRHARQLVERLRVALRGSPEARHARAHRLEPEREPAALEAGVPGQEDAAAAPEGALYSHSFQGGVPDSHSSCRWRMSRTVSTAYQNPSWRYAAS